MSFNKFHTSLQKFDKVLEKLLLKEKPELLISHIHISDFDGEIRVVAERIRKESKGCVRTQNIIFSLIKENKNEEVMELAKKFIKLFTKLRLDIKDFYIHTRIFLDVLCGIIGLSYGKNGKRLPKSMTELLKKDVALEIDKNFFEELRNKMSWYNNFVEDGREIELFISQDSLYLLTTKKVNLVLIY